MNRWFVCVAVALLGAAGSASYCADAASVGKTVSDPSKVKNARVSIDVKDTAVRDVLKMLGEQTGERLVVESSVGGKVTAKLIDVSVESALNIICKTAGKTEWRKLYLPQDSELTKQPEKLAATVRLLSGMSFPNLVVSGSSTGKVGAYFEDSKAIGAAESAAVKTLGMQKVYLITNDAAVAEKALAKDKKESGTAVEKYTKMQQDQMDAFMKMTPEEREQAIMMGLDMAQRADPTYMAAVMNTLMNSDPGALKRIVSLQTNMLSSMTPEARRAMIKLNMQAQKMMSPELQQLLMEDAKAVMEDMKAQQDSR